MSIEAVLTSEGRIVVTRGGERLREGRINEKGLRELHPVEAAYPVYTDRLKRRDELGQELGLEELFKRIDSDMLWILFIVYSDLRRKGKRVRPGPDPRVLYIERGDNVVEMLVLEENSVVSPEEILQFIKRALSKGFEPMIAIVDMYGDITYYEISKVSFKPIERV